MKEHYAMLINNELVQASTGDTMEIINPADGSLVALAPRGGPIEIDRAVAAAKKAGPDWASKATADRSKIMYRLSRLISAHHEELARLETMQYGGPMSKTKMFDIPFAAELFDYYAGVGRGMTGLTLPAGPSARAMTVREPLGVIGLITPWNFPLVTAAAKLAPALVAGNSCVLKPPSCAPLTVLRLGELVIEAGVPAGVINIVTGPGSDVGEALVRHPDVAKINFTGDSSTGKRIMALASRSIKPVASELGGKNAFVVLKDADLETAVEGAVWSAFFNSGQNCGSPSRFIVHDSLYDEFAERFVTAARSIRYGDPMEMETMMGPVAYREHRDGIEKYIRGAKEAGARLLLGGERPDSPETREGFFVAPTIFGECESRMEFMQEEIFGPVAGLIRFKADEEAVDLVNDTRYGLCASIWTKDIRKGLVMTGQLKVGTVWLNQHLAIVFEIPWGGCKESGWTKENSTLALDEYTMQKHVWIDLVGRPATPWQDLISLKNVKRVNKD